MFRKRRRPTPEFGIPPPYSPATGQHANLLPEGAHPYCAMMQVAAEDEYDDYVMCRGFDPRIRKFIDYEEGNEDKPGIAVAKPFGGRGTGRYVIGEIYPAFLPLQGTRAYTSPSPTEVEWRLGQNPGTVDGAKTGGHPGSLDDTIERLKDHNDKYVNWMLITPGGIAYRWFQILPAYDVGENALDTLGECEAEILEWNAQTESYEAGETYTLSDVLGMFWGLAYERVMARSISGDETGEIWEVASHGQHHHQAILDEDLMAGESAYATVQVWDLVNEVQEDVTVTVYDKYLVDEDYLGMGTEIGIGYNTLLKIWIAEEAPCS